MHAIPQTPSPYTGGGYVNKAPSYGMIDCRIDRLATKTLHALKVGAFLFTTNAFPVVHAQSSDCTVSWQDGITAVTMCILGILAIGSCLIYVIQAMPLAQGRFDFIPKTQQMHASQTG